MESKWNEWRNSLHILSPYIHMCLWCQQPGQQIPQPNQAGSLKEIMRKPCIDGSLYPSRTPVAPIISPLSQGDIQSSSELPSADPSLSPLSLPPAAGAALANSLNSAGKGTRRSWRASAYGCTYSAMGAGYGLDGVLVMPSGTVLKSWSVLKSKVRYLPKEKNTFNI